MDIKLLLAIIFITLALVFYSIGVWMEKLQKQLKLKHLILFLLGLVCDSTGTALMTSLAEHSSGTGMGIHGITGAIAIILMIFHAVWAAVVLIKKDEKQQKNFHKFSMIVWFIWLIPYLMGMIMGMGN